MRLFALLSAVLFASVCNAQVGYVWTGNGGYVVSAYADSEMMTNNVTHLDPPADVKHKPSATPGDMGSFNGGTTTVNAQQILNFDGSTANTFAQTKGQYPDVNAVSTLNPFFKLEYAIQGIVTTGNTENRCCDSKGAVAGRMAGSIRNDIPLANVVTPEVKFNTLMTLNPTPGPFTPSHKLIQFAKWGDNKVTLEYDKGFPGAKDYKLTKTVRASHGKPGLTTTTTYYEAVPTTPIKMAYKMAIGETVNYEINLSDATDPRLNTDWKNKTFQNTHACQANITGAVNHRDDKWQGNVILAFPYRIWADQ